MQSLDTKELGLAKEIVRRGLLKAADSLSFFMQEKVGINELNFQVNDKIGCPNKKGANIHLLTTEVMGELPGLCYLVFSQDEANRLKEMFIINFGTRFTSSDMDFNPEFVWMFDHRFLNSVKNLANSTETNHILN